MNDSLHSLFLAQAMGLYFVVIAIIMIVRSAYYKQMLANLKPESGSIALAASIGLILGIVLVLVHNIWIFESEVLVTLVAWTLLIKSVLWLSLPECMLSCCQKCYSGCWYYIAAVLTGILGVFLMAHGFFLFGHGFHLY